MKLNNSGHPAIGVIIIIGMIWGAIATVAFQQIHGASKPVAVVAK